MMCTCATHCPESPHHERACCSAVLCDCWCHRQYTAGPPPDGRSVEEHLNELTGRAPGYPAGWPRCPGCGDHAMDGHITCGRVECNEAGRR